MHLEKAQKMEIVDSKFWIIWRKRENLLEEEQYMSSLCAISNLEKGKLVGALNPISGTIEAGEFQSLSEYSSQKSAENSDLFICFFSANVQK